jgi:imidazolonepropionase-like amidohydrolase
MIWLLGAVMASEFAIINAHILPVVGTEIEKGTVWVQEGKVTAVGAQVELPEGISIVDAEGRYLMPGIIDVHSHMGVYSWPSTRAHSDGNEASAPITASVRAEDSIRVADPAFEKARAGGVTTVMVLPGSANLIGGMASVIKLRPSRTLQGMQFPNAPKGMKMACGENPKRVYGDEDGGPSTRMGNLAYMRRIFSEAQEYESLRAEQNTAYDSNKEVLVDVLNGEVRVHIHCYRQDDIEGMYRVMDSFGIQIASFQHALEAYKVRDLIIEHGTAIATWPDWWGFKMEAYEAKMVKRSGGVVALHSDSANTVQRMYTEASKMLRYDATEQEVLEMITLDPAKMLGIADRVGSIEVGKDADLALFSLHPLDVYTRVDTTWIDGVQVYKREER